MRVLVVDHTGGIGVFRKRYEALARRGDVDLAVLVPKSWIEHYRVVEAEPEAAGYRVLTGDAAWRGYENRGFFYTGLLSAIRKSRPDVVHLLEEPYGLIALQSAILVRLLCPRAKVLFHTFDNLHEGFRYPYRPSAAYGVFQRIVHRLGDAGTVANRDAARILRSRGFAKPIRFLPLGLDETHFCPSGALAEAGTPVVGYVGRMLRSKGIYVLLDALAQISSPWRLLVVGSGEERVRFSAEARERGWEERVEIRDGVPHADVPALLRRMNVLVVPSLTTASWKEQFGRVLIEAMACEVPVVGSDSGAIPEVIGTVGEIVPEGDPAALAATLDALLASPERRATRGRAGRDRVLAHFTWTRVAERMHAIYDELLEDALRSETAPPWYEEAPPVAPAGLDSRD